MVDLLQECGLELRRFVGRFVEENTRYVQTLNAEIVRPLRIASDVFQDFADIPIAVVGPDIAERGAVGSRVELGYFAQIVQTGPPWGFAWAAVRVDDDDKVERRIFVDTEKVSQRTCICASRLRPCSSRVIKWLPCRRVGWIDVQGDDACGLWRFGASEPLESREEPHGRLRGLVRFGGMPWKIVVVIV